jgi:hypothetical protein
MFCDHSSVIKTCRAAWGPPNRLRGGPERATIKDVKGFIEWG